MNKVKKQEIMMALEINSSLSVNIQLLGARTKYLVFKPAITIVTTNKDLIEIIKQYFKIKKSSITTYNKYSKHQERYSLKVQDFKEIREIVEFMRKNLSLVKSEDRFSAIKNFETTFKKIEDKGHIHTRWSDEFEEIIDLKLEINSHTGNISKNRISKKEWVRKTKKHLAKN